MSTETSMIWGSEKGIYDDYRPSQRSRVSASSRSSWRSGRNTRKDRTGVRVRDRKAEA
jgi:hypothetical protein